MTFGTPAAAQASIVAFVRASTSSRYRGLLKPFMKGAPGMPLGAIAQVNPYRLSTGQSEGGTISTETQPSSLATWHVRSMSHLSPAELKHQKTIECRMRPRKPVGLSCDGSAAAQNAGNEPAAAAAIVPCKTRLRPTCGVPLCSSWCAVTTCPPKRAKAQHLHLL